MTLVNDRGYNLTTLCGVGLLGQRTCSESEYQSWRRVAISVRKTLLSGEYVGEGDLFAKVRSWLEDWVQPAEELGAIKFARLTNLAKTEAEPDIDRGDQRFPPTLRMWQGNWDPGGVVYNEKTESLGHYIREGYQLYKDAASEGVVTDADIDTDLARAEDRPEGADRPWIKWAIGGTIVTAATVLLTWVYATIKGAKTE